MRPRALAVSALACSVLTLAAAWLFDLSLERAVLLAPAFVVGAGLATAVCVVLLRAAVDSLRESGHPRLVAALIVAGVALVAVLAALGVSLPRE